MIDNNGRCFSAYAYLLPHLEQAALANARTAFSMIFAEFCGGMVGIFGEYHRSLKRIATVRRDFA